MGIFRRKPAAASSLAPTGHAGDDELLAQIALHSDLEAARHWVHYVYVAHEEAARLAAEQVSAGGWEIQAVDPSAAGGPEWVVVAEQHGAITTPDAVRTARQFFESVAAAHPGGEYDGWEASL
jgi:hypothetical protein